ncbi:MAG: DNA alkylation repair protein [Prevotella sp.]|nr:DNA alkylation repair protein [Prevotella sp.]
MTTDQQILQIKQSFRLMMDGATAQSMRDKGLDYHLNWGATLPRLREMAQSIAPSYPLAIALWKENVRECKILATMLMPPDEMLPDVADLWMEQTPTIEIAEQAAFNLYQHMPAAAEMAYRWIASPDDLTQLCGYHILSRLFMQRREPNERGINEFVDQATAALRSPNISLRKAAMQAVSRFAQLGLLYERIARSALRSQGLDFL